MKHKQETKDKISKSLEGRIPWNKGKKISEKNKRALRKPKSNTENMGRKKGYKQSEKQKEKISLSNKGKHNKGKSYEEIFGNKKARDLKKNLRKKNIGKKYSQKTKEIMRNKTLKRYSSGEKFGFQKGRKMSKEEVEKMKQTLKGRKCPWMIGHIPWNKGKSLEAIKGENHWNWKGGKTTLKQKIRGIGKYLEWRSRVLKRDNYHCQKCGKQEILEIHHIIPLSKILKEFNIKSTEQAINCKELWDINNGVTLCLNCHMKIDKHRERWGIRQKCSATKL